MTASEQVCCRPPEINLQKVQLPEAFSNMANFGELEATYQSWTSAEVGSEQERLLTDSLLLLSAVQIRRVVSKLSVSSHVENAMNDLEDTCGNAMLKLYKTLVRWRIVSSDERPVLFKPYINEVARNVYHDQMRERYPFWFSLAGRVLWRLRHSPRFVVSDEAEYKLCALTETAAKEPQIDRHLLEGASASVRQERDWSLAPLENLLEALLGAIGSPVPFELLVDCTLRCTGEERNMQSLDEEVAPGLAFVDMLSHPGPNPEQESKDAELLHWLWNEVKELPDTQRQVCGLNLEAAVGIRLEVFVLRRVADKGKYEVLIRPLLLKHLPGYPPLPDPVIGRLLKKDAKQVSNARVSAQRRLGRRLETKKEANGSNARKPSSWREGVGTRS